MNSADQIGQLNDLRYKMHPGKNNLSRVKSEIILGSEMPVIEKEFRKKKLTANMGARQGE